MILERLNPTKSCTYLNPQNMNQNQIKSPSPRRALTYFYVFPSPLTETFSKQNTSFTFPRFFLSTVENTNKKFVESKII